MCLNELKNKTYHTARVKCNTPNTDIHDHSISWIGTRILIKSGDVKLVLWTHLSVIYNDVVMKAFSICD